MLGALLLAAAQAPGCFCLPEPTLCSRLSKQRLEAAFFVGRVKEVWPPREQLAREQKMTPAQQRQLVLARWGQMMKPEERRLAERTDSSLDALWAYRVQQRVRFEVSEQLLGPTVREVITAGTSCGYRFERGERYVVEAEASGGGYTTRACGATQKLAGKTRLAAERALRDLRAARDGRPPVRISGQIAEDDLGDTLQLRLTGPDGERVAPPAPDGSFEFEALARTEYQLEVSDGRGARSVAIDLRGTSCAEARAEFREDWVWWVVPQGIPIQPKPRQKWVLTEPPPFR